MSSKYDAVFDVKKLREYIEECNHTLDDIWEGTPLRSYPFDNSYNHKALKWLAEGHASMYGVNVVYDNKPTPKVDFSHYNCVRKEIVLCAFESDKVDMTRMLKVFCHELAHHIQNKAVRHDGLKLHDWLYEDFDRVLRYERTAEKLAYYIYKTYFEFQIKPVSAQSFSAYRSKKHVAYLKAYVESTKVSRSILGKGKR